MNTLARRSIQTIKNKTQIVSSFFDANTSNEFVVRRLIDRTSASRQLFIVTLNNEAREDEVIPFAEIATSSTDRLRYVVKPNEQYPALANNRLMERIESLISSYMHSSFSRSVH